MCRSAPKRMKTFEVGMEPMCASIPIPTSPFVAIVLFSEQLLMGLWRTL